MIGKENILMFSDMYTKSSSFHYNEVTSDRKNLVRFVFIYLTLVQSSAILRQRKAERMATAISALQF